MYCVGIFLEKYVWMEASAGFQSFCISSRVESSVLTVTTLSEVSFWVVSIPSYSLHPVAVVVIAMHVQSRSNML